MEQLFNGSMWRWMFMTPADWTRAWFAEWPRKQVSSDTHAEKR